MGCEHGGACAYAIACSEKAAKLVGPYQRVCVWIQAGRRASGRVACNLTRQHPAELKAFHGIACPQRSNISSARTYGATRISKSKLKFWTILATKPVTPSGSRTPGTRPFRIERGPVAEITDPAVRTTFRFSVLRLSSLKGT